MTNYWKQMKIDASDATKNELEKRKEAYEKAHDIRKFEIGLFWQRATYYWAFILAAFTAHFALAVTAFFCYFFSLCWVLMNKGSKFWQKNWEGHIDELEREFSGDLYKVILNTNDKNKFCCCPFSLQAYDYSVSKITMITSIALMVASFLMFLFYTGIIFFRCIKSKIIDFTYFESLRWEVGIVLLLGAFALSLCIFSSAKGNDHKKEKQNSHWINRDELIKK